MRRHQSQPYPYPPHHAAPATATPHRYSSAHSNSSAFSASANPNEDWTKISDLAERRRIQNRIAQRNYRKKLKKRLEDLERKAASSSASPEPRPEERAAQPALQMKREPVNDLPTPPHEGSRPSTAASYRHALPAPDENAMFTPQYRQRHSPSPPVFSYSTYPPADGMGSYHRPAPYHQYPMASPEVPLYNQYLPPVGSSAAPAAKALEATGVKQEYEQYDDFNSFNLGYSAIGAMEPPVTAPYQDPNLYTPPLSDSLDSFESSIMGSPPDLWALYPDTAFTPDSPPSMMI